MEYWKTIKGYPNYSISNLGNVYSFNIKRNLKPKIDKYGYYVVGLCKDGKVKCFTIHRLVASHFLEPVDNCNVVNHKDSNKLNNEVSNLEWTNVSGNTKHCFNNNETFKRQVLKNAEKGIETNSKSLDVYLKDKFVGHYNSILEASKSLNISEKTIYNAIHNKYNNRSGYKFILS